MGQKTAISLVIGLGVILFLGAFGLYFFSETAPWEIPALHSRRSAKEYCSCRFVVEDSRENCSKKIFDIIPFGELVEQGNRVQMTFLWSKHIAYLENKKLGCKIK
jgi:hypothetical protein